MQIETPQAVAIYCRLSKEDLDENKIDNLSRSIQNQKSMLTDFAEINGWQIFDIYCDDNLSGVARDRPEFNRLIRDASLRKFNIILCKNQSRFTRDMQLVEKYIHGLFPIWGIRFVGMVDGADTSVKGNKKARQINGLVNQWYLENLSDNIKATLKLKRIRGKYTGSVLPYGYRPDPDDINCFIIDPVAASVVRRIWEMHAGGIGAPTIARTLNEEGIPNPTSYAKLTGYSWHNRPSSSLWSAGCIYSILHNETYLGTLCQGRQLTPEGQFHSKKKIFQKTNGFAQWATIRQSLTMSYCVENLKQGRKPELTIFTSKKRTFPQAFSVRKSVVQAVEKFLQKEKLYVKRDTNVPFSARPEKKALRTAKVHSYPRSILKAQFSMS